MQQDDNFIKVRGRLGSFELDVEFNAPLRGVTALFGPSGCGKTSVLRSIAGLNRLTGTIRIGASLWQGENFFLPPHKRPIGYVFQEASLFPHLSVCANLSFGMGKKQKAARFFFDEIVSLLALEPVMDRYPHHLSGGECQRVAIGRALLSKPHVLLMDEPLSALDQKMREEIMPFLMRLRQDLRVPIFYITHDMKEVERLADYLILMQGGRVIASGTLQKLQADLSLPLARGRDATVSLEAQFENWDAGSGLATFLVGGNALRFPLSERLPKSGNRFSENALMRPDDQHIRLQIAAGDVSLTLERPKASSILNILPVRILSATAVEGHEMLVSLILEAERTKGESAVILSRLSRFSWDGLKLHEGMRLYAQIKGIALHPKF